MEKVEIWLPSMSDYGKFLIFAGLLIILVRPFFLSVFQTLGVEDPLYVCLLGIGIGIPWYFIWKKVEDSHTP